MTSPPHTDVPFLDMRLMHEPLRESIVRDFDAVVAANAFINGPAVREFEAAFATYCHASICVGLASGLDALRLALLARDYEPGSEAIVPAQTFVATLEGVTQAGLVPVPVEIGLSDYCLDPSAIEAAITPRTRVIVPVHLYGQLADMRAIRAIAERHGLDVLEDAAQAHGATRDGVRAGTTGFASGFSFYPGKNLGAMGDAGAVVTDDEGLAERIRALREHGQRAKYVHDWDGYTARLDTLQAVALLHKLPLLDGWNRQRADAAGWYGEGLAGVGDIVLPPVAPGSEPVWHLYVVRTADPDGLAAFLRDRGVGTGRHYPFPVHLAPAFAGLGHGEGSFPLSEALARECLSLPIYPGITGTQVEQVVSAVRGYFADGR